MIKHQASHVDHSLNADQLRYLLDYFADRETFFLETVELPEDLGTVPCGLWGPSMGDPPVPEDEVIYAPRGTRAWSSRLTEKPTRPTRLITVVAGPYEETCPACHENSAVSGVASGSIPCCSRALCEGGQRRYVCVLYTAFGGPPALQEPGDPGCKDPVTSSTFWRAHALVR